MDRQGLWSVGEDRPRAALASIEIGEPEGETMDTQGPIVEIDGSRLHYATAGSGDPVLLLHGATLDHRMWDDQVAPFARHHRVIHWLNDPLPPLPGSPLIERLEGIGVPTLVIVGERDLPDFQRVADTLHERVPRASKVMMPGVGHMANMEDPERFTEIVVDFLRDVAWAERSHAGDDPRL